MEAVLELFLVGIFMFLVYIAIDTLIRLYNEYKQNDLVDEKYYDKIIYLGKMSGRKTKYLFRDKGYTVKLILNNRIRDCDKSTLCDTMLHMFWIRYIENKISKKYFYKGIDYLYDIYKYININQENVMELFDKNFIKKIEYVCKHIVDEGIDEYLSESNIIQAKRIVEKAYQEIHDKEI